MATSKKKRYLDALTQALGIGGHEASASAASDVSEPPLKTQKVGHHVESAVADPLKSRPRSDISKGLHHVQPVGGVSIGLYESSDGIVAACSVVEEETRFEVTDFRRNASAKGPLWSATLKPLPDRGASKAWMMRGEPQGDVLVESEDGFVQVAASSETKRRVWRYVGLLEGHDRLGREPSDRPSGESLYECQSGSEWQEPEQERVVLSRHGQGGPCVLCLPESSRGCPEAQEDAGMALHAGVSSVQGDGQTGNVQKPSCSVPCTRVCARLSVLCGVVFSVWVFVAMCECFFPFSSEPASNSSVHEPSFMVSQKTKWFEDAQCELDFAMHDAHMDFGILESVMGRRMLPSFHVTVGLQSVCQRHSGFGFALGMVV